MAEVPSWVIKWVKSLHKAGTILDRNNATQKRLDAFDEAGQALEAVIDVYQESEQPPTQTQERALKMLFYFATGPLQESMGQLLTAIRKEREYLRQGRPWGSEAYGEKSWLKVLEAHPEWMERKKRGNGMGWKVSADKILSELERMGTVVVPDRSTISRERNRRLKK